MRVGITGTRYGMTAVQAQTVLAALRVNSLRVGIEAVHHGKCVGVDCEVHALVKANFEGMKLVVHPPVKTEHEGEAVMDEGDEERQRKSHFARNRDIVDETDGMLVVPFQDSWQPKGGTWYTHDYALKTGKPVVIVWPDGTTTSK